MTLKEAIDQAYLLATGKPQQVLEGSANFNKLIAIANIMCNQWQNEPGIEWRSRIRRADIGEVDLDEPFYKLPKKALKLARRHDPLAIISNGAYKWKFSVKKIKQFGRTLDFSNIITESMAGAEISVSIIERLPELLSADQDIEIDNPYWLVNMMAAEFVRNDRVRGHMYGDLITYAQNLMESMKFDNAEGALVEYISRGDIF